MLLPQKKYIYPQLRYLKLFHIYSWITPTNYLKHWHLWTTIGLDLEIFIKKWRNISHLKIVFKLFSQSSIQWKNHLCIFYALSFCVDYRLRLLARVIWNNSMLSDIVTCSIASNKISMLNPTFNNISIISWRSVLLVEETRGPGKNYLAATNHW